MSTNDPEHGPVIMCTLIESSVIESILEYTV